VASGLAHKAVALRDLDRADEALSVLADVITLSQDAENGGLQDVVGDARAMRGEMMDAKMDETEA
jgi:predicted RNA-binding protein